MAITRQQALDLLHTYIKNEKMIFHCLASEAVMRGIARKLGRDEEKWGLAGLLHDLDVEITNAEPIGIEYPRTASLDMLPLLTPSSQQ